jgi:hypothetical protein
MVSDQGRGQEISQRAAGKALEAAQQLVTAWRIGEESCSVEWEAIEEAVQAAREALQVHRSDRLAAWSQARRGG